MSPRCKFINTLNLTLLSSKEREHPSFNKKKKRKQMYFVFEATKNHANWLIIYQLTTDTPE